MLNKENVRELAYLVKIDNITPIEGYDRVELAHVGGWTIVVGKGEFAAGDIAIYFEIDSKLPEVEPFSNMEFLVKKHYKIKTQKMCKSISSGMLVSIPQMGWKLTAEGAVVDKDNNLHFVDGETRFLTDIIGVTYAVTEDNKRKAKSDPNAKYKSMFSRHPKFARSKFGRWCGRHMWAKKLLYLFWGKKSDAKKSWPAWVKRTDEERAQNIPWILNKINLGSDEKMTWIATEKIDGTSTTITVRRKGKNKFDTYVCSRNVVFDTPDKACFYDTNVYLEMNEKYHISDTIIEWLKEDPSLDWITVQGETYGPKIQVRDYSMPDHCFMAFNYIDSKKGRWNSLEAKAKTEAAGIPWVPIVCADFRMPDTVEELLTIATGESVIDGGMREGLVFRSLDGIESFKAVSNEFLLKYHQ